MRNNWPCTLGVGGDRFQPQQGGISREQARRAKRLIFPWKRLFADWLIVPESSPGVDHKIAVMTTPVGSACLITEAKVSHTDYKTTLKRPIRRTQRKLSCPDS